MTVELAHADVAYKPWGRQDLSPWCDIQPFDAPVGEIRFERADVDAAEPSLLFKLLFTDEPLSIQVHPDDAYAKAKGSRNGKTEAWYVLGAQPDAKVAVGLTTPLSKLELRSAIEDGSISKLVSWRSAKVGDTILVPAGTIHAIGSGLVIVEIQQRSDTTFRLFDYGRSRELHIEEALAVAITTPAKDPVPSVQKSQERTLLIANPHFVLENLTLPGMSNWQLRAEGEMWFLVVEGHASVGAINLDAGQALFIKGDAAGLRVGAAGMKGLLAYPGPDFLANSLSEQSDPLSFCLPINEVGKARGPGVSASSVIRGISA